MKINQIWELPILSSDMEEEIRIEIRDLNIVISFDYIDFKNANKKTRLKIKFESVLCHMHTSERFTKTLLNAYDTLVEIEESDWVNELKNLNESDWKFWNPKHFAIFFDKVGMYQFIARSYNVETEEI